MSLQTRLTDLAAAIGADVKTLQAGANGSSWKRPVRFVAGTNVNIAAPGANIDGVAAAAGDRVLLNQQTTATERGIWVYNGAAVPMTRATDADSATKLVVGTSVFVTDGNTFKWSIWRFLTGSFATQTWLNSYYFSNTSYISGSANRLSLKAGNLYSLDQTGFDMAAFPIKNLADPTSAQDAATKHYVDVLRAQAAKVTHNAAQAFSNGGANNLVAFNTVVRDDMGAWATGTNTRLTPPTAGWYHIRASCYMGQGSVLVYRQVALRKNGTAFLATTLQDNSSAAYDTEQEVSCVDYFSTGDYVEVIVFFSGPTLTISSLPAGRSPQLSMVRVG